LEAWVDERTAELVATNHQLVAQIEEQQRVESTLQQMQRLEAIEQLTSGVAHDFNAKWKTVHMVAACAESEGLKVGERLCKKPPIVGRAGLLVGYRQ
jgi:C4-dicarboxylate-specific signal transduction histidine kinase